VTSPMGMDMNEFSAHPILSRFQMIYDYLIAVSAPLTVNSLPLLLLGSRIFGGSNTMFLSTPFIRVQGTSVTSDLWIEFDQTTVSRSMDYCSIAMSAAELEQTVCPIIENMVAQELEMDLSDVQCEVESCTDRRRLLQVNGGGMIVITVMVNENEKAAMQTVLESLTEESILAEMQKQGCCYDDAQTSQQICTMFEDIGGDPNRDYIAESCSVSTTESKKMTEELVAVIALLGTNFVTFIALVWTCILLCRRR